MLKRATAVTLGMILALFAGELLVRTYNHFRPSPIFSHEPRWKRFRWPPHILLPEWQRTNSWGFNGPEYAVEKKPGTYRILGIGDSFAFGMVPQQYNYLALIQTNLSSAARPVEVVNMGIPGTGPPDYLALLKSEGLALKPDMVLISFFLGNDFDETRMSPWRPVDHSYLVKLWKYWRSHWKNVDKRAEASGPYQDDAPTLTPAFFRQLEIKRSYICERNNPAFIRDFQSAVSYMLQIQKACSDRGIKLAVVEIPDELQVNANLRSLVLSVRGTERCDFEQPNRALTSALTRYGIPALDLTAAFEQGEKTRNLYKIRDTHWNIPGNAFAAERISEFLKSRL